MFVLTNREDSAIVIQKSIYYEILVILMRSKSDIGSLNSYDFFYYDYSIFCDLGTINEIVTYSKKLISNLETIRGILYFKELLLINLIHHIELLSIDSKIDEIVQWGNINISDSRFKGLAEKNESIKLVYELNKIRKQFTDLRLKEKISDIDLINANSLELELKSKLFSFNNDLIKKLSISFLDGTNNIKKKLVLNRVISWFNYIEGDIDYSSDFKGTVISSYPGGRPFFYLMPENLSRTYYLQNDIILKRNGEYFIGYKLCLIYLYEKYIGKVFFEQIKTKIIDCKNWHDLHMLYTFIFDNTLKKLNFLRTIISYSKEEPLHHCLENSEIKTHFELDFVFRRVNNLDIKIFKDRFEGDYPNTQNFFFKILIGYYFENKEVELLEFKQIYEEGNWIEYSYAIYSPIGGFIWDSSHWLFFDNLTVESNYDPSSDVKLRLKIMTERFKKINLTSYTISGNLLKNYLKNKDYIERKMSNLNDRINTSKGLLSEFMGYLYLSKKFDAKLIDIHKDVNGTDIDVYADNDKNSYILQSKQRFPFNKEDLKEVKDHFKKVISSVVTKKPITKLLFIMSDQINDDEISKYMDDNELSGFSQADEIQRKIDVLKDLAVDEINVVSFNELYVLLNKNEHTGFLGKINKIYSTYEED